MGLLLQNANLIRKFKTYVDSQGKLAQRKYDDDYFSALSFDTKEGSYTSYLSSKSNLWDCFTYKVPVGSEFYKADFRS